jgi:hypothetical protein
MGHNSIKLRAMGGTVRAMGVKLPTVADHPNAHPWSGVLTVLDEPSDRPPHGSDGKLVILPRAVAEAALPSLLGMPVNFDWLDMDDHVPTNNVGTILNAEVVQQGGKYVIAVSGILFSANFPMEVEQIQNFRESLGMSYELAFVRVEDRSAPEWVITECVFTGAAILLKDKAAYQNTSLAASAAKKKEKTMEELLKQLLAAAQAQGDTLTKLATQSEATNALLAESAKKADEDEEEPKGKGKKVKADDDVDADDDMDASKAVKALTAKLDAMAETIAKLAEVKPAPTADLNAGGAPERKTLPPAITALLAKAGVGGDSEGPMTIAAFDVALNVAGVTDPARRIAAKGEARRHGLLK